MNIPIDLYNHTNSITSQELIFAANTSYYILSSSPRCSWVLISLYTLDNYIYVALKYLGLVNLTYIISHFLLLINIGYLDILDLLLLFDLLILYYYQKSIVCYIE